MIVDPVVDPTFGPMLDLVVDPMFNLMLELISFVSLDIQVPQIACVPTRPSICRNCCRTRCLQVCASPPSCALPQLNSANISLVSVLSHEQAILAIASATLVPVLLAPQSKSAKCCRQKIQRSAGAFLHLRYINGKP